MEFKVLITLQHGQSAVIFRFILNPDAIQTVLRCEAFLQHISTQLSSNIIFFQPIFLKKSQLEKSFVIFSLKAIP